MTPEDYAVVRLEDLQEPVLRQRLGHIVAVANSARGVRGLGPLRALVVESTDPGYHAALGALANRKAPAEVTTIEEEEQKP